MEKTTKIKKPWGREEILTCHKKYTFKKLFIKAGCRTSLQYHNKKHETMYFLSGEGKVELRDKNNKKRSLKIKPHLLVVMEPGLVHRVSATKDLLYLEASTSDLKDVIRLEDDYNRIK